RSTISTTSSELVRCGPGRSKKDSSGSPNQRRLVEADRRTCSASSPFQFVSFDDAVTAILLFDPAESNEAGDRLVDAFARGAHHASQLFLGDRQRELVGVTGEFEEPFGGAAGDIEEHRVGQGGIGGAQASREQLDDTPEELRTRLVDLLERAVGQFDEFGGFEGTCLGRTSLTIEEA